MGDEFDNHMDVIKAHLEAAYGFRAERSRAPVTPEDEEFEVSLCPWMCIPWRLPSRERNALRTPSKLMPPPLQDGEKTIYNGIIAATRAKRGGSVGKTTIGAFTMEFMYSQDAESNAELFHTEVAGPNK